MTKLRKLALLLGLLLWTMNCALLKKDGPPKDIKEPPPKTTIEDPQPLYLDFLCGGHSEWYLENYGGQLGNTVWFYFIAAKLN
jgi:hypothetical protein